MWHEVPFQNIFEKWIFEYSLDRESNLYTACVVPKRGIYVFKMLSLDLKTGPIQFQKIMENIFMNRIKEGTILVYIGDIIICTKEEKHI